MRSVVSLLALGAALGVAACGHGGRNEPAWPKPYVAADASDGGESLAPRSPSQVAEIEDSEDDTPTFTPTPSVMAPVAPAAPAAAAPTVAPTAEPPIQTEDITIEVDD
jgi:hypothetical protein